MIMTKFKALLQVMENDGIFNAVRIGNKKMRKLNLSPDQMKARQNVAFDRFIPVAITSNPLLTKMANEAAQELLMKALHHAARPNDEPTPKKTITIIPIDGISDSEFSRVLFQIMSQMGK